MRRLHLLVALLVVLFLSGCAAQKSKVRFVWPPPPEQPRLEWVGVYFSQDDMQKSAGQEALEGFLGGTGIGRFKTPFGIVSDDNGRVYISDIHAKDVLIYDFNQGKVGRIAPLAGFATPLGLAIDSKKNVYVADGAKGQVFVFDKNNRAVSVFGKGVFRKPAYIAVNEALGRIYVSDSLKHEIAIFDLSGKYLFSFGTLGNGEGQFFSPQGLAFSPEGQLFVVDMFNARIQVFDSEGVFQYAFGERNDTGGGFETPKDLAFDSEGHVYVVDGRRSIMSIFSQKGEFLLMVGDGKPSLGHFGFNAPRSVFIGADDRIYVSEALGRRFAVWQYMGEEYRRTNPFTEQDVKQLLEHMERVKRSAQ